MSNETVKQDAMVKMASEQIAAPAAGTEIATTAAAAETAAMIQARYIMAIKAPRNIEQVRLDLLKECSRPSFALVDEKGQSSALYRKPVGWDPDTRQQTFVEGLGIRFAEVAMRCMKNLMAESFTVQENDNHRVIRVIVIDLESNISYAKSITLAKTVERKNPRRGAIIIGQRTNSQGETTFTVKATDDDLATKEAAQISKAVRTLILRMVPGDLQDECEQKIRDVRAGKITEDPDAAKRKIIDGMALQNVSVVQLEEFLGHPVEECSPQEILNLQALYGAIRDGETTWAEISDNVEAAKKKRPEQKVSGDPTKGSAAASERAKAAEEKQAATQAATKPVQPKSKPTLVPPPPAKEEKSAVFCISCGVTDEPMVQTEAGPMCKNCAPKPEPKTEPKPAPKPAASAPAKPVAKPVKDMPWMKKPAAPAPTTEDELELPLAGNEEDEDEIERVSPKMKEIKGVKMPQYADRAGDDVPWDQEQYDAAVAAFSEIPGSKGEAQMVMSINQWIGLPVQEINAATLEALTLAFTTFANEKKAQQ